MTPLAQLVLGLAIIVAFISPLGALAVWAFALVAQLAAQGAFDSSKPPVEPFGPEDE